MTTREIRKHFLDFFCKKAHKLVPSAPIVVKNDPTLMFTNAGMNQFKNIFLGEAPVEYARIVDTQRCLRVSGKHNDLEEVGIDTYHHTMFEMLGVWSFGDYFKKEAINWSWELLTQIYKVPAEIIYATVFGGDVHEGLAKDQESYDYWRQYLPEERILLGTKKDNFWEMGDTGPCGPCSEITIDCRSEQERRLVSGRSLVNNDHPQVIEIWNNVFIQYNRLKDGSLQPLPSRHVDVGVGLERLVRVLQRKASNYDTDVFQPLVQYISQKTFIPYGQGRETDIAMRVMADHIRAIAFAIADGQLPSNTKAGYVIRRILRRAVRYAYAFLNRKKPFLYQLVPLLAEQFKGIFDELALQQSFVAKVIIEEEQSFFRTLEAGIQRFERYLANHQSIDGAFAFELYDTFGFPIDLTELMARERGVAVDMQGFEQALGKQKSRSRAATTVNAGDWVQIHPHEETEFVGYDALVCSSRILKYREIYSKGQNQYQLVLDRTPFYAEGGGQVGDSGLLEDAASASTVEILDTRKENGQIIHIANFLPKNVDQAFLAKVNAFNRQKTACNHSATHLLHAALKQVLGGHVQQKGSLVNPNALRFDFAHFEKINEEKLLEIESLVNEKIRDDIQQEEQRQVPYQEALKQGVTALFGEKYGDKVRIITFGQDFSKELCGGIHVNSTGCIGYFKIIAESAVAAGVRRVEAVTGAEAEAYVNSQIKALKQIKLLLKQPSDLIKAIENQLEENKQLKKEVEKAMLEKISLLKHELAQQAHAVNGLNVITSLVSLPNLELVKNLAHALKHTVPNLFLVLGANIQGKPTITVAIAENVVQEKNLNASHVVNELAKGIKGGGGGQASFATAGGKDSAGLEKALEKAKMFIQ